MRTWIGSILRHWVLRELLGIILLLSAIVYVPVLVSERLAIKEVPFQNRMNSRNTVQLFVSQGEVKASMIKIVRGQLDALRRRDYGAAWDFASRETKIHLPVADFERMVSAGFAVMTQNHTVEIGAVANNSELGFVDVKLSSELSGDVYYAYVLFFEGEDWAVAGVKALDPDHFERRRPKRRGPNAEYFRPGRDRTRRA